MDTRPPAANAAALTKSGSSAGAVAKASQPRGPIQLIPDYGGVLMSQTDISSPDGKYRWDGQAWQPVSAPPSSYANNLLPTFSKPTPGFKAGWDKRSLWMGIAAIAVVAGVVGGFVVSSGGSPKLKMSGHMAVKGSEGFNLTSAFEGQPGQTCETMGGFGDIRVGTPVTVYDAKGNIVGTGSLGTGVASSLIDEAADSYFGACTFPFSVTGLSKSSAYQVQVGAGNRGRITVSPDEVSDVELSLTSS